MGPFNILEPMKVLEECFGVNPSTDVPRNGSSTGRAKPSFCVVVPLMLVSLFLLFCVTGCTSTKVLAYSAGAMIASPGLARAAGEDPDGGGAPPRLGEVYYAAPDIDLPVFVENLPRYQPRVRRVTVALNLSHGWFWMHGGIEYPLLWLLAHLSVALTGPGSLSMDATRQGMAHGR